MRRLITALRALTGLLIGALLAWSGQASAVPAFARQTGMACMACHVSFPELTPFGRFFKMTGYTLANNKTIPLSGMVQISRTNTRTIDQDNFDFVRNGDTVPQQVSLFYAGRIAGPVGAFAQWTYDGVAHHSALDNTDIRAAWHLTREDVEFIYGVTVNNNPTVSDVWNSTPAFGYPYAAPSIGVPPLAGTLVDGALAQQVVGASAYVFWQRHIYAELGAYRTADQAFSVFRAGQDTATPGGVARLSGANPYWRVAYNQEWGSHSVMFGTFGLLANRYPDNTMPGTPTDRFKDYALDAQYQYLTMTHAFTAQTAWIHEQQNWRASFPSGGIGAGPTPANPTDHLDTFKAKASYYYQRKYGGSVAYFSTTGNADPGLYAAAPVTGSANGRPDTQGLILELDYLPHPQVRLALQYTWFLKFNGARTNYDGNGRNAADNNTIYLLGWFMF
ncbi:cytochrome C [Ralstonia mojiangensis]|uniref:Cytochrome C n=1 Tax=Ralstonia mojiangensis TaxID=2953895 RepID=A0AAE3I238_9RALS|nr:cytochrome C [Ralstonia mojiangensis]MCO5412327.1 cytochrome C [Ralstonia mojiangensis]MCT7296733.1 cytochrome C [Ralstonia mojiangensis]MCT7311147.1 cytochrome C [Ralstonia mojiangensis]MCT7315293.1 cytochrome C [Ralstonia mojiangensis]MCT7325857.1 cytochrome C [Ralstonia mojiangensis]